MLHLSKEKFEKIDKIASQIAELKPGYRDRQKTYAAELKRFDTLTQSRPPWRLYFSGGEKMIVIATLIAFGFICLLKA